MASSFDTNIDSFLGSKVESANKKITNEHIDDISRNSCSKWKSLPAHLELNPITVKDIDERGNHPGEEKRKEFFTTWKSKKGSKATYKILIQALLNIDCREDAEYVRELLKNADQDEHPDDPQQQQQPGDQQQQQQQQHPGDQPQQIVNHQQQQQQHQQPGDQLQQPMAVDQLQQSAGADQHQQQQPGDQSDRQKRQSVASSLNTESQTSDTTGIIEVSYT